jgi:hypothetical protein
LAGSLLCAFCPSLPPVLNRTLFQGAVFRQRMAQVLHPAHGNEGRLFCEAARQGASFFIPPSVSRDQLTNYSPDIGARKWRIGGDVAILGGRLLRPVQ